MRAFLLIVAALAVVLLAVFLMRSAITPRSTRVTHSNPPIDGGEHQSAPQEKEQKEAQEEIRSFLAAGSPAEDGVYRVDGLTLAPDADQPDGGVLAGVSVQLDLRTGDLIINSPQRIDDGSAHLRGTQRIALAEEPDPIPLELDPKTGDETGVVVHVDWGTAQGTWKDLRDWAGIARLPSNGFTFDLALEFRFAVNGCRYTVKTEVELSQEGQATVRVRDGRSRQ